MFIMKNKKERIKRGKIKNAIVEFSDFVQSSIFILSVVNTIMAPLIKMFEKMSLPSWISKYGEIFDVKSIVYWINCAIMVLFIVKLGVVITQKNEEKMRS